MSNYEIKLYELIKCFRSKKTRERVYLLFKVYFYKSGNGYTSYYHDILDTLCSNPCSICAVKDKCIRGELYKIYSLIQYIYRKDNIPYLDAVKRVYEDMKLIDYTDSDNIRRFGR